ncbi:ABC transporter substrate-binding protein [Roseovarius sp. 2305UL8-3]|uniref:ABC transporter substrate-binding protein n=1 Tax=Roseovarius conchicola TaxID=3121636 RepID=UPI0035288DB4
MKTAIKRRTFLGTGAAAAATAAGFGPLALTGRAHAQSPQTGGVLRLGLDGGSTSGDSLDPRRTVGVFSNVTSRQIYNGLVVAGVDGSATPELAESWEVSNGNTVWIFKLRPGVTFHDGKALTSADVAYSLNLHRGETAESSFKSQLSSVAEIATPDQATVVITLSGGNPDFPFTLTDWRAAVVQDGTTDFTLPVGTGPFKLTSFEPGVKSTGTRNPDYWKEGQPYVDEVQNIVINDATARSAALRNGDVDIIDNVDFKTAGLLGRLDDINVWETQGRQHFTFPMNAQLAPFDNVDVALAIKHGFDREAFVKTILRGHGSVGNDNPIPKSDPFYSAELEQRIYDPERSRFHLQKAGLESIDVTLDVSRTPYGQAVDAAILMAEGAKNGGVNIKVNQVPEDGYWKNVWLKSAWCASFWSGRPTADLMFSAAYSQGSSWNETRWHNERFEQLLVEARSESDAAARKAKYAEMQLLVHNECPTVIPAFASYLDAGRANVMGWEPNPNFRLHDFRIAETVWFG